MWGGKASSLIANSGDYIASTGTDCQASAQVRSSINYTHKEFLHEINVICLSTTLSIHVPCNNSYLFNIYFCTWNLRLDVLFHNKIMYFRNQVMVFPLWNDWPWVTAIAVTGEKLLLLWSLWRTFLALVLVLVKVHCYLNWSTFLEFVLR